MKMESNQGELKRGRLQRARFSSLSVLVHLLDEAALQSSQPLWAELHIRKQILHFGLRLHGYVEDSGGKMCLVATRDSDLEAIASP